MTNTITLYERKPLLSENNELLNCDLVVNVLDPELLAQWTDDMPKMYFVDSLSWMWDKPLENMDKIACYYVQDYLSNQSKNNEYQKYTNVKLIPPISKIIDSKSIPKKNMLLVNFSGVHNPYVGHQYFINYCTILAKCIIEEAEEKFETIKFSLNKDLAVYLEGNKSDIFGKHDLDIEFGFYSHSEFLKMMCEAKMVLSNAGITTTLELYNHNKCFAYLLGSNYSQALITQKYFDEYNLKTAIPFSAFGLEMDKLSSLPEEEGVAIISSAVKKILMKNTDELKAYFRKVLNMSEEELLNSNSNLPINMSGFGQNIIAQDIIGHMNDRGLIK